EDPLGNLGQCEPRIVSTEGFTPSVCVNLSLGLAAVPGGPRCAIVSQVLQRDLAKRLEDPFFRCRVEALILAIADELGYSILPQLAGQHPGVGKVASGAFAQVVRCVVVEYV